MLRVMLAATVVLFVPAAAFAQQIDLTHPLTEENGQPVTECAKLAADGKSCAQTGVVTVGHAMAHALFLLSDAERGISGDERWKRGDLGLRISHQTSISLTVDEAKMVKDCVGKAYPPLVVVQLFPLLDPNIKKDAARPQDKAP